MKKEDFHKGQTVWVYLVGNAARGKKTTEERVQEWEVISVGRKYITARPRGVMSGWDVKFEIDEDFCQVYNHGCANYVLYLSKEAILEDVWRGKTRKYIKESVNWYSPIIGRMSDEDLKTVSEIFKKYDKDVEKDPP